MAVLPLRILPEPVLRQKAKRVREIDDSLLNLVQDMVETMEANNGVGIAANQVGILRRVIVIQLPEDEEPRILINPEIIRSEGEREVEEGCLSIPGYRGLVRRSIKVRAKALNALGQEIRIRAEDLLAQALEHEVDHLNGNLYIDRLVDKHQIWKLDSGESATESEKR